MLKQPKLLILVTDQDTNTRENRAFKNTSHLSTCLWWKSSKEQAEEPTCHRASAGRGELQKSNIWAAQLHGMGKNKNQPRARRWGRSQLWFYFNFPWTHTHKELHHGQKIAFAPRPKYWLEEWQWDAEGLAAGHLHSFSDYPECGVVLPRSYVKKKKGKRTQNSQRTWTSPGPRAYTGPDEVHDGRPPRESNLRSPSYT